MASLTTPRIYQFNGDLRKAGRSVAMRRAVLTNLKTILTFCQSQGLVAQNVARGVKIKSDDRRKVGGQLKEGRDFPSKAQLRLLIDRVSSRWRPFFIIAVFTGMRASELRGLCWRDVDLAAGQIHVRQRADAWRHIGPPKSAAGTRDVPLVPMAINALRLWHASCPSGELDLVPATSKATPTSSNASGTPSKSLAGSSPTKERRATAFTLFDMRRQACSSPIWVGRRIVRRVLGRASITMTFDRYGHLFEDQEGDKEAMKRLEAAISAA